MGDKEPHYLMQFFNYSHLPQNLKDVSRPFCQLAVAVDHMLGDNSEKTVALRKLLEAKDSAVRSFIAAGNKLN